MTEWHVRYGGREIMIYWHVEREATCIYSQLRGKLKECGEAITPIANLSYTAARRSGMQVADQ
jgi:hypothetical protein